MCALGPLAYPLWALLPSLWHQAVGLDDFWKFSDVKICVRNSSCYVLSFLCTSHIASVKNNVKFKNIYIRRGNFPEKREKEEVKNQCLSSLLSHWPSIKILWPGHPLWWPLTSQPQRLTIHAGLSEWSEPVSQQVETLG